MTTLLLLTVLALLVFLLSRQRAASRVSRHWLADTERRSWSHGRDPIGVWKWPYR